MSQIIKPGIYYSENFELKQFSLHLVFSQDSSAPGHVETYTNIFDIQENTYEPKGPVTQTLPTVMKTIMDKKWARFDQKETAKEVFLKWHQKVISDIAEECLSLMSDDFLTWLVENVQSMRKFKESKSREEILN